MTYSEQEFIHHWLAKYVRPDIWIPIGAIAWCLVPEIRRQNPESDKMLRFLGVPVDEQHWTQGIALVGSFLQANDLLPSQVAVRHYRKQRPLSVAYWAQPPEEYFPYLEQETIAADSIMFVAAAYPGDSLNRPDAFTGASPLSVKQTGLRLREVLRDFRMSYSESFTKLR